MRKNDQAKKIYTRINNKTNNIHSIIGKIFAEPGISIDTINEVSNLQEEVQNISTQINSIWSRISSSNAVNSPTSEFDLLEDEIDRVKKEINDLYEVSKNENEVSKQIRKLVEFDKSELIKARDFHRKLSYFMLGLLGLTLIFSFGIIYFIYGIGPITLESLANAFDQNENRDLVYILTRLTGKISILIGIAWLIKYLGNLHSNHSQQYIAYQDRLSGLNTAEFILNSGKSSVREKVILQLADTYLSLKENAFKVIKEENIEVQSNKISVRDLKYFAKVIGSIIKK
jgi:hypothetical protein